MISKILNGNYVLELNESEALIIYDVLYKQINNIHYDSYAEKKALLQLQGILEDKLTAMFRPEFDELINTARINIIGNDEVSDQSFLGNN